MLLLRQDLNRRGVEVGWVTPPRLVAGAGVGAEEGQVNDRKRCTMRFHSLRANQMNAIMQRKATTEWDES